MIHFYYKNKLKYYYLILSTRDKLLLLINIIGLFIIYFSTQNFTIANRTSIICFCLNLILGFKDSYTNKKNKLLKLYCKCIRNYNRVKNKNELLKPSEQILFHSEIKEIERRWEEVDIHFFGYSKEPNYEMNNINKFYIDYFKYHINKIYDNLILLGVSEYKIQLYLCYNL